MNKQKTKALPRPEAEDEDWGLLEEMLLDEGADLIFEGRTERERWELSGLCIDPAMATFWMLNY